MLLKSAASLLFSSILSRSLTFTLNILLVNSTTPSSLGTWQKYELLSATLLFTCREWIRLSLLRPTTNPSMAWYPLLVGVLACIPISIYYVSGNINILLISVLIDLATEPYYAKTMVDKSIKARIESLCFLLKSIILYSLSSFYKVDGIIGINSFILVQAASQFSYSLLLLTSYYFYFYKERLPEVKIIKLDSTAATLAGQSILKHILTECDGLVSLSLPPSSTGEWFRCHLTKGLCIKFGFSGA